jgi:hypothetical protein
MAKSLDEARIRRDFRASVNLSADELESWLETPESRRVGFRKDDGESVGHAAGRRILAMLRAPSGSDEGKDLEFMRKVVGFVRRHRAQEPANMVTSRWRYSLMNWGHDPLKQ